MRERGWIREMISTQTDGMNRFGGWSKIPPSETRILLASLVAFSSRECDRSKNT